MLCGNESQALRYPNIWTQEFQFGQLAYLRLILYTIHNLLFSKDRRYFTQLTVLSCGQFHTGM